MASIFFRRRVNEAVYLISQFVNLVYNGWALLQPTKWRKCKDSFKNYSLSTERKRSYYRRIPL